MLRHLVHTTQTRRFSLPFRPGPGLSAHWPPSVLLCPRDHLGAWKSTQCVPDGRPGLFCSVFNLVRKTFGAPTEIFVLILTFVFWLLFTMLCIHFLFPLCCLY
jgi:hypothetical protein